MKPIQIILCISFVLLALVEIHAQGLEKHLPSPDTTAYAMVDDLPILVTVEKEYRIEEVQKFIHKHLKWPDPRLCCEGTVVISFIVEKDGSVSHQKFFKKLCPKIDEEAMRVIGLMDTWKPGILEGREVRTAVSLPISFRVR